VDTVVSTLVMCTVDDVEATLAEVRRVLKPGGAYIFLDHVAAPVGTPLRTMQEVLSPLNRVAYEGCRLTRDPEAAVKAEFGVENCEVNRFVAGSTAQSWLVGASPVDVAARWKETGGGLQPHFLLAPSVYGVARA
jgi:SAM-dependent methyltransferase